MNWYRNLSMTWKTMLPITFLLILAFGTLTWLIQARSSEAIEAVAERELSALAGKYGNDARLLFEESIDEAQAIADGLTNAIAEDRVPSREALMTMLQGIADGNDKIIAVGSAWEPNMYDGKDALYANTPGSTETGRFAAYLAVGQEVATIRDMDTSRYYQMPKERNHSFLTRPSEYDLGGEMIFMTTAAAVVKKDGKFAGIIMADMVLDEAYKLVDQIQIYQTGNGAIATDDGYIVAHTDHSLVGSDLFATNIPRDREMLKKAMQEGQPFTEIHDNSGIMRIYYYYPIHFDNTGQNWYFIVSAPLDEMLAEVDTIRTLTITISLVTLLIIALIIFFVVRANTKPMGMIASAAQEIAEGNYDRRLDTSKMGGEVLVLCKAIETMIESLVVNIDKAEQMTEDAKAKAEQAAIAQEEAEAAKLQAENAKREGMLTAATQLEDVVAIVSSASEQLTAQIENSEQGASQQAASVAETATAMEQMNSTVLEVARSASAAAEVSTDTRHRAEEGAKIVHEAVEGIQRVQEVSMLLKGDMDKLSEQANSISEIMEVISDIADQTNLLALNAAIEAARAGEAGRGFAVVADEVRKLAEKTMASTMDVGNAITNIQKSVNESMQQVDTSVNLVKKATEKANLSGAALEEIVGMIDAAADQVRAIATASEEQSASSEQINHSISQVSTIAGQTALDMQEASKAVSELANQAQTLNGLIEDMKNS